MLAAIWVTIVAPDSPSGRSAEQSGSQPRGRQPSRALIRCNPFSNWCSPLLQIIAKCKRLNDPTAKLEQDEVDECDSAWSATRARRGALSCKMNVLYVLPLMEMGHRQELLGWTKVLVTEHEHFVEEIVVDEAEQKNGCYLGYAMFEEFANAARSLGWSKKPVRLQLADVGAEAADSMYKRLKFQQWKRPEGNHVIGGRRCRVPWTDDDDPKEGCKMLQASFDDMAMNAKLAADRGSEGRASRKIKFIVCLGLSSNQAAILEDEDEDEDEDEACQEDTGAAHANEHTEHAAFADHATAAAAAALANARAEADDAEADNAERADHAADTADHGDAGAPTNAQNAARPPNCQRKPSHPPHRRNNKRHLELQDVFDDLGLADGWERFQYILDGRTCAGLRPVHKDTAGPKPAKFKSVVGRARLTWPRLQVSKAYAARVDQEKTQALNSILIDALDRRLVPASDVDTLVTKLCAHIKELKREIASLALLQDQAEEEEEGDEGVLPSN